MEIGQYKNDGATGSSVNDKFVEEYGFYRHETIARKSITISSLYNQLG